jgi:hypothetical protein
LVDIVTLHPPVVAMTLNDATLTLWRATSSHNAVQFEKTFA